VEQQTPSRQEHYNTGEASWYRPVIGIPCCGAKRAGARYPLLGTYRPFTELIELAGATPLLLPPVADPAALAGLVALVDGLLLPGGGDVHPQAYGEEPHPLLGTVDVEEDALELSLVREALTWHLPLLGVNRGMQVLNVACGGSLFQDLRSQLGQGVWSHVTTRQARTYLAHPVSVVPKTRLAEIVKTDPLLVNSFHHQGVKHLGAGLAIGALAPDDVIESIELGTACFALGVQWSLEALALDGDQRMLALFQAFIDAARVYGSERRGRGIQARNALSRWEQMWVCDQVAYTEGRRRLLGEEPLGALEELELRRDLPVLKGRLQATAQALNLSDPTPPAGWL